MKEFGWAVIKTVAIWILHGWVIMLLWGWFAVPLGVPRITLAHALGIDALVSVFRLHVATEAEQMAAADAKKRSARGLAGWTYVERGTRWLMFRRALPPPGTMDAAACAESDERRAESGECGEAVSGEDGELCVCGHAKSAHLEPTGLADQPDGFCAFAVIGPAPLRGNGCWPEFPVNPATDWHAPDLAQTLPKGRRS